MSTVPEIRRSEKALSEDAILDILDKGFSGHLATVGQDGFPYCVPLLYVWMDGKIWVHATAARGHLRNNVDHDNRVCFEVDEPGEVFPYGRFECDTTVSYRSVIVFGRISVQEDEAVKKRFCEALMRKYGDESWDRLQGFFPRLHQITVYAIEIDRKTGKTNPLPQVSDRWPAKDNSKTPNAVPPD